MAVDKILISHVVSELIIICGLAFYYHKRCNNLQQQINELNSKLEKLSGTNYINSVRRQEQFELQTVQQINKIYSILNSISTQQTTPSNSLSNTPTNLPLQQPNQNMFTPSYTSENVIKENYSNMQTGQLSSQNNQQVQKNQQQSNPLMNTLSMLGPLTTMFKVVMEPKPQHPNEIFENIDIKTQLNNMSQQGLGMNMSQRKIVEVEDDDIDSETLDNELKDELNDLRSNVTSAMNTPIMTPKLALTSNIPTLDMCDNGVCKLNFENDKNDKPENIDQSNLNNKENNITLLNIEQSKLEVDKTGRFTELSENVTEKSSPLRYISQPETKRGRPKKVVQTQ